jgi:uncharacterized protein YfiM (DUF2279 family)
MTAHKRLGLTSNNQLILLSLKAANYRGHCQEQGDDRSCLIRLGFDTFQSELCLAYPSFLACFMLLWSDMTLMPLGGRTGYWVGSQDARRVVGAPVDNWR